MADGKHCAGCRGFTADYVSECPGIPEAAADAPHMKVTMESVPRLAWRDRLRALIGKTVPLKVGVVTYGGGGGGKYAPPPIPGAPRTPGIGGGGASAEFPGPSGATGGPG
jgi:hypothetical protein